MKRRLLICPLLALLLPLSGLAHAQLLGEVLTVAAISAELNPSIRLPMGSYRVLGSIPPTLIARVPNHRHYTAWEAYTATGLAAHLQPAFVQQLATSLAVAGYFLTAQSERQVGGETHTHYLFTGDAGDSVLLYTVRTPTELVWLIARQN